MARIGLWGGSFNPPTKAHKALADFAFQALALDELWWIVAPHNPLKDIMTLAPFQDRFTMVKKTIAGNKGMKASDIEQHLGSSFTVNTVRHIRKSHPQDALFWFIGADNWENFHLWGDDRAEIFDYASLVIFQRPGYEERENTISSEEFKDKFVSNAQGLKPYGSWAFLHNEMIDMAATQVREQIKQGRKPLQITEEIWTYIQTHGLYKGA